MMPECNVAAEPLSAEVAAAHLALFNAFESLGDNCEFAFVQSKYGSETSGLLRWAVVPAAALLKGLQQRFDGLYQFERLTSTSDAMVRDEEYGLFFHTKMRSKLEEGTRAFVLGEEKRRKVHEEELRKMNYLKSKLISRLEKEGTVFVYKRNLGIRDEVALGIRDALRLYHPSNHLMLVQTSTPERPTGEVWLAGPGLIGASIDRFAPYERADDASFESWLEICRGASALAHSD